MLINNLALLCELSEMERIIDSLCKSVVSTVA